MSQSGEDIEQLIAQQLSKMQEDYTKMSEDILGKSMFLFQISSPNPSPTFPPTLHSKLMFPLFCPHFFAHHPPCFHQIHQLHTYVYCPQHS
jgi:hypothetical protein